MEQDWPKEPLKIKGDLVYDADGNDIAFATGKPMWPRLIVCYNACAGIPTEDLMKYKLAGILKAHIVRERILLDIQLTDRDAMRCLGAGGRDRRGFCKAQFAPDILLEDAIEEVYQEAVEKYGPVAYEMFRPVIDMPKLQWNEDLPRSIIVKLVLRNCKEI